MGPRLIVIVSSVALVLIGLVMVYSASSIEAISETGDSFYYIARQAGFTAVGVVLCFVLAKFVPYRSWLGVLTWVVWGLAIVLLLLTAVIGRVGLGAQRWLVLGPISLQPSEFAKIAFLLMSAKILFEYRQNELSRGRMILYFGLLILLPLLVLYRTQSDLGTTLICFVGILALMWIAEVPWPTILAIIAVGAVFALLASFVGYRADRWAFINPWADYYGAGYQIIHSFYAFSQGGIFGTGLGNSAEKYLYLPEAETDFIFSIIGEELGMVGAVFVIALFLLLLYGGLRMAQSASDGFGSMLCGSFAIILVFQAFLNIGCVIGVLPTTGKPLPFISSGGSSLIASLIMVGIMLSVSYGSDDSSVYRQRREDLRLIKVENGSSRSASGAGRLAGSPARSSARATSSSASARGARTIDLDPGRSSGRTSAKSGAAATRSSSTSPSRSASNRPSSRSSSTRTSSSRPSSRSSSTSSRSSSSGSSSGARRSSRRK